MTHFRKSFRSIHSLLSIGAVIAVPSASALSDSASATPHANVISSTSNVNSASHLSLIDYHAVLDHVIMALNKDPAYMELSLLVGELSLSMDGSPDLKSHDIGSLIKGVDGLSAEIRKPIPEFSIIGEYAIHLEMIADGVRLDAKPVARSLTEIVQWVRYEWVRLPI